MELSLAGVRMAGDEDVRFTQQSDEGRGGFWRGLDLRLPGIGEDELVEAGVLK